MPCRRCLLPLAPGLSRQATGESARSWRQRRGAERRAPVHGFTIPARYRRLPAKMGGRADAGSGRFHVVARIARATPGAPAAAGHGRRRPAGRSSGPGTGMGSGCPVNGISSPGPCPATPNAPPFRPRIGAFPPTVPIAITASWRKPRPRATTGSRRSRSAPPTTAISTSPGPFWRPDRRHPRQADDDHQ